MNKVFCDFRDIVIDDMCDVLYVDTTCRHIGSDENAMTAFGEALERLIALSLRAVAVNLSSGMTRANKTACYAICTMLRANEDKEATFAGLKQMLEKLVLLILFDFECL